MNILLVSHGAALGGSPISMLNIARYSRDPDINYHFAFGDNGPVLARAHESAISVTIIPHSRKLFGIPMILRYAALILSKEIDIVHLNTFTSYYKYPAVAAKLVQRKIVWFVRENPEEKRCRKLKNYANLLANRVVTVSHDTAIHMTYIRQRLLVTIHNGIDTDFFSRNAPSHQNIFNSPYIINISSLEPRKGVLELIKAFSESKLSAHYKLVLLGEDRSQRKIYHSTLLECINEAGLNDRVIFVGTKEDVRPYISGSTFVTLVSHWEGLSRVLLEAAAMGKPILASRNGGNKEVVFDKINGLLVDAGNINQITNALNRLIENENLQLMSKKSRDIATQYFDMNKNIRKIESLYQSI